MKFEIIQAPVRQDLIIRATKSIRKAINWVLISTQCARIDVYIRGERLEYSKYLTTGNTVYTTAARRPAMLIKLAK